MYQNLTRPGIPPPVDVFPERIGQIWGISSESAKFKPSRASQSPKYHWRLHRSVLASDRGAPPPATSYCFFKFNRGKYGTPCKNWKVNRIHVNVLFIRRMFYAFPNQICTYCGRRSKKLWPNIWTQSRQSCSGNRGANSLWVKPNRLKKTKQLKQKNETWNQKISEIEVTVLGARPAKKFAQLQVDFTWDKTGWKLQHELHLCTNKLVRGKTTITCKGNKKLTDDKKERNNSKLGDVGLNTHHFWSKNPCFLALFLPLIWWFFALGFVPWIQWTRSLLQILMGLCYDSQLLVGQTLFYQSMKRSGT